jgi:hypothetical protein
MTDIVFIVSEITKGMKSFGPKCLLSINGVSLIEYQIKYIRKFFKKDTIYLITGFEADKIKKHIYTYTNISTKNIVFIEDSNYEKNNQAAAILQYAINKQNQNGSLFINNGILIKNNFLKNLNLNKNHIFSIHGKKSNFDIGSNPCKQLEYLFYDLPVLWSECAYFNYSTIEYLKNNLFTENINSMFFFELINKLIEHEIDFANHSIPKTQVAKILNMKDVSKIRNFIH